MHVYAVLFGMRIVFYKTEKLYIFTGSVMVVPVFQVSNYVKRIT